MKNSSLLSLAAVLATVSLTLVVGSSALYSVVPCIFLLLIAVGDYGPKARYRTVRHASQHHVLDTRAVAGQRYRLAA
jgi:hypothetical protein